MSLLMVMLGVYGLIAAWGMVSVTVGSACFVVCIYLIVPAFSASESYQLSQRYAEVDGGPSGLLSALLNRLAAILAVLAAPARLPYVAALLAGAGVLLLLSAAPSLAIIC
jgi:hypothetical protein